MGISMAIAECQGRDWGYRLAQFEKAARRVAAVVTIGVMLSACGGARYERTASLATFANPRQLSNGDVNPRMIRGPSRLQCVPYARARSRIEIRGDAWTWWRAANGRYRRGSQPAVGAVLVLKRKGSGGRGHLAVVTRVLNDREIVVDHANWLNRGRIHKDTLVRDVSARNDWSAVKVWYTPGRQYGLRTYHPYGFIYPMRYRESADARP